MNFGEISNKFSTYGNELLSSKVKAAKYRGNSYLAVSRAIDKNTNANDAVTLDAVKKLNLTDYMTDKVMEINAGGKFKPIKRVKKSKATREIKSTSNLEKQKKIINELVKFMGIGKEKAKQLVSEGLKNVNQLHMKKWLKQLPKETAAYLTVKPEQKIPREHIKVFEKKLQSVAKKLDVEIIIVGSYRRLVKTSRDIDVMIVSDEDNILDTFLTELKKKTKAIPYSKGNDKMSVLVDFSKFLSLDKQVFYKVDVFKTKPEHKIPMMLYATGSKDTNIIMRRIAKRKNLLLNQKGLFKKTDNKLVRIQGLKTERDYFDKLRTAYKEPEER